MELGDFASRLVIVEVNSARKVCTIKRHVSLRCKLNLAPYTVGQCLNLTTLYRSLTHLNSPKFLSGGMAMANGSKASEVKKR